MLLAFYSKLETGGIFRAFTLSVNSWKCHVEKIGFTWPSMEAKSGLKKAKDICCMLLYEKGLKSVINLLWEPSTFLVCGLFCIKTSM